MPSFYSAMVIFSVLFQLQFVCLEARTVQQFLTHDSRVQLTKEKQRTCDLNGINNKKYMFISYIIWYRTSVPDKQKNSNYAIMKTN